MFHIRFRNLRKNMKLSQKELADILSLSNSAISSYEQGVRKPDYETLLKISNFFKVSTDYLIGNTNNPYNENIISVPIVGTIRAGQPILAEENILGYQEQAKDMLPEGEVFYLKVKGNSMNLSKITDGSLILVKKQNEIENGEIGVILVDGNEATVKKFYKSGNTVTLIPHSSEPEHQPQTYDLSTIDIHVIGKVTNVWITL